MQMIKSASRDLIGRISNIGPVQISLSGCDMWRSPVNWKCPSSLTRLGLLPEGVEDPVPLGLLAVDGGDVDEAFEQPPQRHAEVLHARARREEHHDLLLVLLQKGRSKCEDARIGFLQACSLFTEAQFTVTVLWVFA